jgi:hypothetical protein
MMPAKAISAATGESTPFLLTAVKFVGAVCFHVALHISGCLASETKHTPNK